MPPKKNTQLKQLKAKWYAKLKKEGFKDIEYSESKLKDSASNRIGNYTFERLDTTKTRSAVNRAKAFETALSVHNAKAEYYYQAEHFLNSYDFNTPRERIIWEYHTNGLSVREIVKILAKVKIKVKRDSVWRVIKHLVTEMKSRLK